MIVVIIRAVLGKLGFNDVDEAVDGSDALARLRARSYGLVICDWNMVPMDRLRIAARHARRRGAA